MPCGSPGTYLPEPSCSGEVREGDRVWDVRRARRAASTAPGLRRAAVTTRCALLASRGWPPRGPVDERAPPHDELSVPARLPRLELASSDRSPKRRLRERNQRECLGQEDESIVDGVRVVGMVHALCPREASSTSMRRSSRRTRVSP